MPIVEVRNYGSRVTGDGECLVDSQVVWDEIAPRASRRTVRVMVESWKFAQDLLGRLAHNVVYQLRQLWKELHDLDHCLHLEHLPLPQRWYARHRCCKSGFCRTWSQKPLRGDNTVYESAAFETRGGSKAPSTAGERI